MQNIQFIQTTPEQLENAILNGVKKQLESLTKSFQPKEPTEYLTRQDVANLLKIDLSTVHNWTKRGKLKAYGIGARIYYKRVDVENAIVEL